MAKTILVVESYHSEHPWDVSYKNGLQAALGAKHELVYYQMDTKRLPKSYFQLKADSAWSLYQKLGPELVVLADDNALEFLGPRFLNTSTPVVYLGINGNPRHYGVVGAPNFYGVLERPLLKRSLVMLKELYPMQRVLLLLDSSPTARVIQQQMFSGKNQHEVLGVQFDIRLVDEIGQWKRLILEAKKQGYDAVIVGLYHTLVNELEAHVSARDVMDWTSKNTPIPSFGFWEFSVGAQKNLGGYVVSGFEEGKLAGEIAQKVLNGEPMNHLPMTGSKGRFVFSEKQLKKWNIELPIHISKQTIFVD